MGYGLKLWEYAVGGDIDTSPAIGADGTIYFGSLDNKVYALNKPDAGLIAHYPFNGNANDGSGNANHGTVSGATLTPDRYGNATAPTALMELMTG